MKRCPKCNRTYTTDTQKFCTHDGGMLVDPESAQAETIRIDSTQFRDAPTKTISRELPPDQFDPYKTVVERPPAATGGRARDTQDLAAPPVPAEPEPPQTSAPLSAPGSGAMAPPPPTSAPLSPPPPPQTSASLPETVSSKISTSAPLPPPQVASAPPMPARAAAPAQAKKSRLPLVLGILAVLFIFGVVLIVGAFLLWKRMGPSLEARRLGPTAIESPQPQGAEPTPNSEPSAGDSGNATNNVADQPAFTPPANAVEFVNSKDNLDGKLAEHYLDFSFYYPNNWIRDPAAGVPGARNFAKVERRLPPDFTQEIFAVAWYASTGSDTADRASYPRLVEERSSQFAKEYPEYRKVFEGETKIGPYDGYEFRFEGFSRNTVKGDLKIWGRAVFLPPSDSGKNGVTLLMLATSLAPELKSIDDLGVKGEMPMILESFRFGKK